MTPIHPATERSQDQLQDLIEQSVKLGPASSVLTPTDRIMVAFATGNEVWFIDPTVPVVHQWRDLDEAQRAAIARHQVETRKECP